MKHFMRDILAILLIAITLTLGNIGSALAVVDYPYVAEYSVSGSPPLFLSKPRYLSPLLSGVTGGDLSIDFGNPFCLAYTGMYVAAMYAGNTIAKGTATAALIAAVTGIYAAASIMSTSVEICGVDWNVWGSYGETGEEEAGVLQNYKRYYPVMGPFR